MIASNLIRTEVTELAKLEIIDSILNEEKKFHKGFLEILKEKAQNFRKDRFCKKLNVSRQNQG